MAHMPQKAGLVCCSTLRPCSSVLALDLHRHLLRRVWTLPAPFFSASMRPTTMCHPPQPDRRAAHALFPAQQASGKHLCRLEANWVTMTRPCP